jgi:uncharacterized protein (DUF924 family)
VWDRHTQPPSEERMALWFQSPSPNPLWDQQLKEHYEKDLLNHEGLGKDLNALLIFSQLPRKIYHGTAQAFEYDEKALEIA